MFPYSAQTRLRALCSLLGILLCWDIDKRDLPRTEWIGYYNQRNTDIGDMVEETECLQLGKEQTCRDVIITFKYVNAII